MKIALDVMGGDYAPREILLGAVQAKRALDVELILVGQRAAIEQELADIEAADSLGLPEFEIVDAPDVIHFDQNPSSVKERRGASIRVICDLVRQGHADACLTMGHTGAGIVASLITFGRLGNVLRPCVGIPYFGLQPNTLLVDAGAMVDCKPEYLAQFAQMGSIYVEKIWGIARPTVGLMTNGREDNKGNELTRTTFALLKNSELNFIGNLEGYDLPNGTANVVVMDGLWGNVALKLTEGLSEQLLGRIAKRFSDAGVAHAVQNILDEFHAMMDYARIGAIPVFGVDGLMLIGHGRSRAAAVVGGIKSTMQAVQVDLLNSLRQGLTDQLPEGA
ncbi:MAG: phosphate acyltransferase PlsX [Chloroflexi bacterium]|nr:phosphate acyltransferase PlsX [Chloroflexota bacterium]